MATLSLDLRERIVAAYDAGEGTQSQIAERFRVSLGMVKKLLQQRRRGEGIASLRHRCGRKRTITDAHRDRLRELLANRPDMTLEELRAALELDCTIQAIHYVLADMGLTFKKRFAPASKTVLTSLGRACAGSVSSRGGTPPGWCSSTSPAPKPT
jgi:transposase